MPRAAPPRPASPCPTPAAAHRARGRGASRWRICQRPGDRSPTRRSTSRLGVGLPRRRRAPRGRRPATSGTSTAASTRATCCRWARSSRSATRSGCPTWVVHRLWLGALLALAAWGVVRLLDALLDGRAASRTSSPARALWSTRTSSCSRNRTSVTLLAYAALPWLLLACTAGCASRAAGGGRRLFALVAHLTGGGVNAAVTAGCCSGRLLLLVYEWLGGGVARPRPGRSLARRRRRRSRRRSGGSCRSPSTPRYGLDFLPFTEQPGAIWATTSITESLRLMGYWLSYLGVGLRRRCSCRTSRDAGAPVLAAGRGRVAARAGARARRPGRGRGAGATRRSSSLLLLAGLLVMTAGFPEGTPLRRAADGTYNHVDAGAVPAHDLQGRAAARRSALALAGRRGGRRGRAAGAACRRARPALAGGAGAALLALSRVAARDRPRRSTRSSLDGSRRRGRTRPATSTRELRPNTRALVLPGAAVRLLRLGRDGRPDPARAGRAAGRGRRRPCRTRTCARSTCCGRPTTPVHQERLVPGQLEPLLDCSGAGAVVTGTDDDLERSGARRPAEAARALALAGLGEPGARVRRRRAAPAPRPATLARAGARCRRCALRPRRRPGIVRVEPAGGRDARRRVGRGRRRRSPRSARSTRGRRSRTRPTAPAGAAPGRRGGGDDRDQRLATAGGVIVASRPRQDVGADARRGRGHPGDAAVLDPFEAGDAGQTVAGTRRAPARRRAPGFPQFPEHRPFAARRRGPGRRGGEAHRERRARRWVEVGFDEAARHAVRRSPPARDGACPTDGGRDRRPAVRLEPGWNRLPVGLRDDALRVNLRTVVRRPGGYARGRRDRRAAHPRRDGREYLRPPPVIEDALSRRGPRRAR